MDRKFYLAALLLIGALFCAGTAALALSDSGETSQSSPYSISYVLGCDAQNGPNPDSYSFGEMVHLEPARFAGKYFGGWYLDSGFTRPCMNLEPGMRGDITLYARWQDDMVGRELRYTFTADVTEGALFHYSIWGDRTVTYRSHDDARGYYMDCRTNTTYDYGDRRYTDRDTIGEWNPDIIFDIDYIGIDTLDTEYGEIACCKYSHSGNGYSNELWIGNDDGVIYKAKERNGTSFGNTVFSYTLVKQDYVSTKKEFSLTVNSDRGIKVTGSGDYPPGTPVVLTAET